MTRYARYKPTGIPWLPEVPDGWSVAKVRQHFRPRSEKVSEKDFPPLSVAKIGVVPQLSDVAISMAEGDTRKLVREGDYVVNSRSDRKGSCGIAPRDGSVTTISIVLEPRNIHRNYVHYLFRSVPWVEEFYRNGRGIVADLWTTRYQEMRNMMFPYPPLPEQQTIAAYLDSKCGKIDRLVAAKEKEVVLLKELKQSMIAEAVTGRTNNRPMKPSGIPWLSEVPEGWEVRRVSSFLKVKDAPSAPNEELLSVFLERGVIRFSAGGEKRANATSKDLSKYQLVEPGDFVMNNQQAWRGSVGVSSYRGIVSPAYLVIQMADCVNPHYANYAFRSRPFVSVYEICSRGVGSIQRNLIWNMFKGQPLPLPPLPEQREIVAYIEARATKIDAAVSKLEAEVAALKEYRERLIADVVTGQRKVA